MQKHLDNPRSGRNECKGEEIEAGRKTWREKTLKTLIEIEIEFEDKVVTICEANLKNYE